MPFNWRLTATFKSGFEYIENEADVSPFDPLHNCAYDVLEQVPTKMGHGPMVALSLIGPLVRYDFDWTELPENAQPIYRRRMTQTMVQGVGDSGPMCNFHEIGWTYVDEYGGRVTHVVEVEDQPPQPQEVE